MPLFPKKTRLEKKPFTDRKTTVFSQTPVTWFGRRCVFSDDCVMRRERGFSGPDRFCDPDMLACRFLCREGERQEEAMRV